MALFGKAETQQEVGAQQQADEEYLDSLSGDGLEGSGGDAISIPYLSITQPISDAVTTEEIKPGHWRNSATGEDYGTSINVIVCDFKIGWVERDDAGKSVARYEPGSIEVNGDLFKGMTNPMTGNKVQECWMYQLVLPDHLDAGYVIYTSTPGQMRYLRSWNTKRWFKKLPSGNRAPIYGSVWKLSLGPDVSKAGKSYFSLKAGIEWVSWTPRSVYDGAVLPARSNPTALLIAAPKDSEPGADY